MTNPVGRSAHTSLSLGALRGVLSVLSGLAVAYGDLGPFAPKALRDAAPDPGAAPGHQHHPVFKFHSSKDTPREPAGARG